MEFLHQLLGASTGRLNNEMLKRMLNRVFNIMYRAGVFPPIPDLLRQTGGILEFSFEGPLARAQKSDELRSVGDTIGIVSNLAAIDPEVWDNYDIDMLGRDVPRLTGSSMKYMRSPDARDKRRADRAQQQQAAAQQAQALQNSQTAKNLGDAQLSVTKAGVGTQEPAVS
jgi:hypothetical protein